METFDFTNFPGLTTERLILREMEPTDAADIMTFRGDPEVEKWNTRSTNVFTRIDQALDWVKELEKGFSEKECVCWGITLRGEDRVIGFVELGYGREERVASIGYVMARGYWGRGIATEAVRAAILFAFEGMTIHRLNINTRIDNLGSMRMMEKLGIPCDGVIRECALGEDGKYQSWAWFGLLEQEYAQWAEKHS